MQLAVRSCGSSVVVWRCGSVCGSVCGRGAGTESAGRRPDCISGRRQVAQIGDLDCIEPSIPSITHHASLPATCTLLSLYLSRCACARPPLRALRSYVHYALAAGRRLRASRNSRTIGRQTSLGLCGVQCPVYRKSPLQGYTQPRAHQPLKPPVHSALSARRLQVVVSLGTQSLQKCAKACRFAERREVPIQPYASCTSSPADRQADFFLLFSICTHTTAVTQPRPRQPSTLCVTHVPRPTRS